MRAITRSVFVTDHGNATLPALESKPLRRQPGHSEKTNRIRLGNLESANSNRVRMASERGSVASHRSDMLPERRIQIHSQHVQLRRRRALMLPFIEQPLEYFVLSGISLRLATTQVRASAPFQIM